MAAAAEKVTPVAALSENSAAVPPAYASRTPRIALLGRLDLPTDGVRDYCRHLSQAFARRGERLDLVEVRWESEGWLRALRRLWKESENWRGRWVLLQNTSLMWSRRGVPAGALAALRILKWRGAKICVVFHDIRSDGAGGWKQRLRVRLQYRAMRAVYEWAARSVLTVPTERVPWLRENAAKAVFIPVGANLPEASADADEPSARESGVATIAVYGITEGEQGKREAEQITQVVQQVMKKLGCVRLVALGRGSAEAADALRGGLDGSGADIDVLGVLAPEQVRENLEAADVLLCIRGHLSTRRGSAIAGIACGLPVVGYRGEETAPPISEAGVLMVESGDRDGIAEAICRVLSEKPLRDELRRRNADAEKKYFSWDAIAAQFSRALPDE